MPMPADTPLDAARRLLAARRPAEARASLAHAGTSGYEAEMLLAATWLAEGRTAQAVLPLRAALAHRPTDLAALGNLGAALLESGAAPEAVEVLGQASLLYPDVAAVAFNHANALAASGAAHEALAAYRRSVELEPRLVAAWVNLGAVAQRLGDLPAARAALERALALDGSAVAAHYNLGVVLERQGETAAAVARFATALRLAPDHVDALLHLAAGLMRLDRHAEAEALLGRAAAAAPADPRILTVLGGCLEDTGRRDAALECYRRAAQLAPHDRDARFSLALAHLARGDFERGLPDYELRLGFDALRHRPPPQVRRWAGPAAPGPVTLVAEQGLGDTLQFARFGAELGARGIEARLACEARLVPLLARSGLFAAVMPFEAAWQTTAGAWLPLASLPLALGTRLATLPAPRRYLGAEARRVEYWRTRLAAAGTGRAAALRIGIAWQGNPAAEAYAATRGRSPPLAAFAPLAALEGVELLSLQQGPGLEQLAELPFRGRISLAGEPLDGGNEAFADTAALIELVDLVVSSDTSIAHLAGALGQRTWVALKATPDWRWLEGRDDSPWYPTMRLFRQPVRGDWASVFGAIASAVRALAADGR